MRRSILIGGDGLVTELALHIRSSTPADMKERHSCDGFINSDRVECPLKAEYYNESVRQEQ